MSEQTYRQLTREGFEALHEGNPGRAVDLLRDALQAASEYDPVVRDEARVNLSQAMYANGQYEPAEEGLREILLRSPREDIVFGAALAIARVRKSLRDPDRAAFYLERALTAANNLGDPVRRSWAVTLRANLAMNAGQFREAAKDYADVCAVQEQSGQQGYPLAVALDNLGYCLVLDDDPRRGVEILERSYQEALAHGIRRYISEASQDICFARLRMNQPADAIEPGERSLEIAREEGYEDIQKNCLFLLGEAHCALDEPDRAQVYHSELQRFYPGMRDLNQFLSSYDISSMITLKEF